MIHKIWGHKKKIDEIVMMMGTWTVRIVVVSMMIQKMHAENTAMRTKMDLVQVVNQ